MNEQSRPEIPEGEYKKPLSKGGDLPPLELLPAREWLGAIIICVEYRVCMFNGQVQYMTKKEFDENEGKEVEVQILDRETQLPIPRREFYITFEFHNFSLPNGNPRKAWLQLGASLGEKAHLPTFLFNVLGADYNVDTPEGIVSALRGTEVRLQLKNKPNKDLSKPPSQRVVFDAVERLKEDPTPPPAQPIKEADLKPEVQPADPNSEHCSCPAENVKTDTDNFCLDCGKLVVAWDE